MPGVVAMQTPKPGRLQQVLDAFAVVSPLVHQEKGCELYAAHTDGTVCVMVERWTTQEDLDAHAAGEPLNQLIELLGDGLEKPYNVWLRDYVPMCAQPKATVP